MSLITNLENESTKLKQIIGITKIHNSKLDINSPGKNFLTNASCKGLCSDEHCYANIQLRKQKGGVKNLINQENFEVADKSYWENRRKFYAPTEQYEKFMRFKRWQSLQLKL